MSVPESLQCEDDRCAVHLTDICDPYICLHYDDNAEAIEYWGRVARGELTAEDVIEPYREFLNFDEATSLEDHFDEEYNWKGPTVDIEVRVNNEPVKTFTAYPSDSYSYPGFSTVERYAQGYMEGYLDAYQTRRVTD